MLWVRANRQKAKGPPRKGGGGERTIRGTCGARAFVFEETVVGSTARIVRAP
jgi:hypothetical protein